MAKHPELQTVCATGTLLELAYLSYITNFLQHKNKSLTMITTFLSVNIHYLLQTDLFLIYFVDLDP